MLCNLRTCNFTRVQCTNLSDQGVTGGRPQAKHHHHHQHQNLQHNHHSNHIIDSEMHDTEPPLSLGKTYDEVSFCFFFLSLIFINTEEPMNVTTIKLKPY